MLRLEAGHLLLVWQKLIVVMPEHDPQEISHEWLCLHMEVPEHLVTAPAANNLDDFSVYS